MCTDENSLSNLPLPFTAFGQFGVGKLDLRVFEQDIYWVDVFGNGHRLDEMPEDYRRNVIIHLLNNARFFYTGIQRSVIIGFLALALEGITDFIGEEEQMLKKVNGEIVVKESLEWLEDTPLMRKLRTLTPDSPVLIEKILFQE
jgi:hypothetical protein